MASIRVDLDDDLAGRLADRARRAGLTPAEVARRALVDYLGRDGGTGAFESFFGVGSSRELRGDRVDELLGDGFGERS